MASTTSPVATSRMGIVARPSDSASASVLAAVFATLLYVGLQGQLPYHDAARFTNQVASDAFVWDIAHVLLQPTVLLVHRLFGGDPVLALKFCSSIASGVAVGLFHYLLQRLEVPRWQAVVATLALAASCSVLTLAPSAHPKLVAFPFVNAALLCLCIVERDRRTDLKLVLGGGALLGIAAAYLASALAVVPFAALALLLLGRRAGLSWASSFWRAVGFGAVAGAVFFVAVGGTLFPILHLYPTPSGLAEAVAGKADLKPASLPIAVHLARVVFGTINNLVSTPGLGATAQAWMRGQIGSLTPYSWLLPWLLLWLVAGVFVAMIYVAAARALLSGRACLVPCAFLAGAQAWTVWYGLNDPEHWFQLTAPTLVLLFLAVPARLVTWALSAWTALAVSVNLAFLALPVATYPLIAEETALASRLRPNDLVLYFVSYPGRPYLGNFRMPERRMFAVDEELLKRSASLSAGLDTINAQIAQTYQDGGRVLVADILDPLDWDAPWMSLLAKHVTKEQLYKGLLASRTAVPLEDAGGIKLWELHPGPGR